jgi:predicted DNA-binding transcriptional regulator AlpA
MDLIMHTPTSSLATSASKVEASLLLPQTGFVRQSQVLHFVPFSSSTLWRRVGQGQFPSPVKLSVGITAWRAEDIRRWIDERAQT